MPVVDAVAANYQDEVTFLAVAGKSGLDPTAQAAESLFSDNLEWGLDDSVWDLYGVPGQPATILVSQGVIVDRWFGVNNDEFLRERIERLIDLSA
ncbi:MAG: hypothetical protein QNJ71_02590 [Acidimicrobiia bacterium]|nr:hypothetical protein [Acidimicrobiia bacterium]